MPPRRRISLESKKATLKQLRALLASDGLHWRALKNRATKTPKSAGDKPTYGGAMKEWFKRIFTLQPSQLIEQAMVPWSIGNALFGARLERKKWALNKKNRDIHNRVVTDMHVQLSDGSTVHGFAEAHKQALHIYRALAGDLNRRVRALAARRRYDDAIMLFKRDAPRIERVHEQNVAAINKAYGEKFAELAGSGGGHGHGAGHDTHPWHDFSKINTGIKPFKGGDH